MSDALIEIHINLQGRVIMRYAGGQCVDVTDTRGCKLYSAPIGEVTVTKNDAGQIVCVTRNDSEGRILSVVAESTPQPVGLTELGAAYHIVSSAKEHAAPADKVFLASHQKLLGNLIAEIESRTTPQPVAPGELAKELSQLYWKAYHAGHNETVEGCYLDVFYRDRFDYWGERIEDIIEEGELPILGALLSAGKENNNG